MKGKEMFGLLLIIWVLGLLGMELDVWMCG